LSTDLGQLEDVTEKSLIWSLMWAQHLPIQNTASQTNHALPIGFHPLTHLLLCSHYLCCSDSWTWWSLGSFSNFM